MTCVAIIPARGGSKRISGKNTRDFAGRPIMAYSIEAARASGLFNRIIVSSDDQVIRETAVVCGAEAPFVRPPEISDDYATTDAVIQHALGWLETNGTRPEYACCLYATAPFVVPDDLRRGFELLREKQAATAFSVTTFPYSIFRALKLNEQGYLEMFWPENRLKRSQELPTAWHDAGQFYWLDVRKYLGNPALFSKASIPVPLPRWQVQDIDTEEDWIRAELMFRAINGNAGAE